MTGNEIGLFILRHTILRRCTSTYESAIEEMSGSSLLGISSDVWGVRGIHNNDQGFGFRCVVPKLVKFQKLYKIQMIWLGENYSNEDDGGHRVFKYDCFDILPQ